MQASKLYNIVCNKENKKKKKIRFPVDTMKCKNCDSDNKRGAKFCQNCGEKIPRKARAKTVRVSPVQKTAIYLELRVEELKKKKVSLSDDYNTPPTGLIDKLMGSKDHKDNEQQIKVVDKLLDELVKVQDMLGGVV